MLLPFLPPHYHSYVFLSQQNSCMALDKYMHAQTSSLSIGCPVVVSVANVGPMVTAAVVVDVHINTEDN